MYKEYDNIDKLYEEVDADKQKNNEGKFQWNRYPIRFVLFDNFRDSFELVQRVQIENHATVKSVADWLDSDYPDWLVTYRRLSSHIADYIKSNDSKDTIIAPFSELARFYQNDEEVHSFDALVKTIKAIQTTNTGWKGHQRVYIPIVGLEGKMDAFKKDTQVVIWYYKSTDKQLNYRLILTNHDTYGVQQLDNKYNIITNIKEWLGLWRDENNNTRQNIICTSEAIFSNAGYAQPDNAFTYAICNNAYEFLTKGLQLQFGSLQYKESEDDYWAQLAENINIEEGFSFVDFVKEHYDLYKFEDYTKFIKTWFECDTDYDKWFLTKYYIMKFPKDGFLTPILGNLKTYNDAALFSEIALKFPKESEQISERNYCLNAAAEHSVSLSNSIESLVYNKLNEISKDSGFHTAMHYVTKLTHKEKEICISWLGQGLISLDEVKDCYPSLYAYMGKSVGTHDANKKWILNYIDLYKKAKLKDEYRPEVEEVIKDKNASESKFDNWYNDFKTVRTLLSGRSDIDEFIWFDGLGIDWIPLISSIVAQKDGTYLNEVMIGKALLPTITSVNKEDLEKIPNSNIEKYKVGDIDSLAHNNKNIYPSTIIDELEIVTSKIKKIIAQFPNKKVAIISDHGMTYLSQHLKGLNIGGIKSDHFGRAATRVIGKLSTDNNYKILEDGKTICALNHHSLASKIPTGQGIHGGCTPEEVLVPIIIISPDSNMKNWSADILDKNINGVDRKARFTIKGILDSDDIAILYNGKRYELSQINGFTYESEPLDLDESCKQITLKVGGKKQDFNIEFSLGAEEDDLFGFKI